MRPGDWTILLIQSGTQMVVMKGSQRAVAGILFARPDDLDRVLDLLGDLHRVDHEIDFQAPAKPSADEMVVNLHGLLGQTGQLSRSCLGASWHLNAHPDITGILADMHGTVDRLQAGVSKKRHLVDHVQSRCRFLQRLFGIAIVADFDSRLL